MDTSELPKLQEQAAGISQMAHKRQRALTAAGANGRKHEFLCYDMVIGTKKIWIAQDDWLPEPGEADPVAEEWPKVLTVVDRYTLDHPGEPYLDTVEDVWVWEIPRT